MCDPITEIQSFNKVKKAIALAKGQANGRGYLKYRSGWTLLGPFNKDPRGCNLDYVYDGFLQSLNDLFHECGVTVTQSEILIRPTFQYVGDARDLMWGKLPLQCKIESQG